jgi:hypothetical protein
MATSLRDLLASYLAGPRLRVMNIDARLAVQATEEAREKQCEPVLVVTLTRKRSEGGLGKVLGRAAGSGAYYVPYGGSGASAAIRGAAIAGAHAVSELAASTKAKDEMTIDYSLARGGTPISSFKRESLKAKSDGEDLVTPLVEKVAEAVVRTVAR